MFVFITINFFTDSIVSCIAHMRINTKIYWRKVRFFVVCFFVAKNGFKNIVFIDLFVIVRIFFFNYRNKIIQNVIFIRLKEQIIYFT